MSDSWDEDAEDGSFGALLSAVAATEPTQPHIAAGSRIAEHYEVIETLGAGGMGVVFLAKDVRLNRKVAVKLHNLSGDNQDRALKEATAMARLQHPNVVAVHDVGQADENQIYIAMEFVDGVTLRHWLKQQPRRGPEIVEAYLQAGRGLQAAHEAGLVHRDVKADNILVGRDGRVRMADFGLAGRRSDVPDASTDPFARLPAQGSKTHGFIGTPAYASPEQWNKGALSARSDQFSFCAALYEALYGVVPFGGDDVASRMANIEGRSLTEGTAAPGTPSSVRKVLARGLAFSAADRHQDMRALMDDLQACLTARRRRLVGGVGAVLVAGAAAIAVTATQTKPCSQASKLDEYWTSARRASALSAVQEKLPIAGEAERVMAVVDKYVARWSAADKSACQARTQDADPPQTLVKRSLCLEHRERAFRAFTERLQSPTAESARRALVTALDLPSADLCADPRYLIALAPPPTNAEAATKVRKLRDDLAQVGAMTDAGDFSEAAKRGQGILTEAEALAHAPVVAEAWLQLGRAQQEHGDFKKARPALETAYFKAQEAGHETVAAEAATHLIHLFGFNMSQTEKALEWGRHAQAVVAKLGGDAALRARVLVNVATAQEQKGQFEASMATSKQAIKTLEDAYGPDHAGLVAALTRLGSAEAYGADPKQAVLTLRRALALAEKTYGPVHRKLERPLAELGQALSPVGKSDEAIAIQQRAIRVCTTTFGPDHINTGFAHLNLGVAHYDNKQLKLAKASFQKAVDIVSRAVGPNHHDTALCLSNLAITMLDDLEGALEIHKRILGIYEKNGSDFDRALAKTNLSAAYFDLGRYERAVRTAKEAMALNEGNGANIERTYLTRYVLGSSLLGLGRRAEAVKVLNRNMELMRAAKLAPQYQADSLFSLARALWPKESKRARALAQEALQTYEKRQDDPAVADKIRKWLSAHKARR